MEANITLRFRVTNPELLRSLADRAMADFGGGIESDGSWSQAIVEVLLHSNPDIASYLDYGIELISTDLEDVDG